MTSRTANMAFAFTDEQAMILDSAKASVPTNPI